MHNIQQIIQESWNNIDSIANQNQVLEAVDYVLNELNCGQLRVAEKINDKWLTHSWLKQVILLAFKLKSNSVIAAAENSYFDKVDLRHKNYTESDFIQEKIRVVPHAVARYGSYIGQNCVLMPSYINVGAYIGAGTLIDTWATIGSCAQIGKNVHISGGVGIGGVLEPLQSTPTIIEDNCFIGARSEIVEGCIIGEGAVISMGVFLGQSTKIYNRMTNEISYGFIPPYSVVIPGTLPSNNGKYGTSCAIIIKQVDASTRQKTSINELLRS